MRTRDLVAALDAELDAAAFQDGQENGLQVEGRDDVTIIVGAVSVSQATIDAAVAHDADALLTHHGLLWRNQPLHVRGVRRSRLKAMMEHDLNLITYHLPLDAHPRLGNNAALADAAGCTDTEPAFPMHGSSVGLVGTLAAPIAFDAWLDRFQDALSCPVDAGPFHAWAFGPSEVQRIGFLSGAAPYQVQDAIELGCDVYVTGEVTEGAYHLAKEAGIHFLGGGHYRTERGGVQRLLDWIGDRFGITTRFVDVATEA